MTRTRDEWNARYANGDLPWDTGQPDQHLELLFDTVPLTEGRALELGCGTGTNALWLAAHGLSVTAVDISPLAIQRTTERAVKEGLALRPLVVDLLQDPWPSGPFDFVFDRGCFHSFATREERATISARVAQALADDGLWFSVIGSTDGPPRDIGPPRLSARDVVEAVEGYFEILRLNADHFDSDQDDPPRAWLCLMRKRGT